MRNFTNTEREAILNERVNCCVSRVPETKEPSLCRMFVRCYPCPYRTILGERCREKARTPKEYRRNAERLITACGLGKPRHIKLNEGGPLRVTIRATLWKVIHGVVTSKYGVRVSHTVSTGTQWRRLAFDRLADAYTAKACRNEGNCVVCEKPTACCPGSFACIDCGATARYGKKNRRK